MQISNLKFKKHHIPTVAKWHFEEWLHRYRGCTLESAIQQLITRVQGESLPLYFVAEIDDSAVGSIGLVECDMDIKKELTPWVSSVYVQKNYRNHGIGTAMMRYIDEIAKDHGFQQIYLYTPDKQKMYSRLGWKVTEKLIYDNKKVSIMETDLTKQIKLT